MELPRIVLASASPSRSRLLKSAGINPEIIVSGVDEEDPQYNELLPRELVTALAIVKAHTVRKLVDFRQSLSVVIQLLNLKENP